MPEYALSIRQPWAWLVTHPRSANRTVPLKPVENRGWIPGPWFLTPQRIHVHTPRTADWSTETAAWIMDQLKIHPREFTEFWLLWMTHTLPTQGLVGEVDVLGFDHDSRSPWAEPDQKHWTLGNPVAYADPVTCPGRLGLSRAH